MSEQQTTTRSVGMLGQALRQPGFVSCLALLTVLAVGFQTWKVLAGVQWVKLAVPPRKELDKLDANQLFPPYKLKQVSTIKDEVLDTLGTDQYISWTLQDTSSSGPEQIANLFVTYYTGKPDQVPHVPEICYQSGGYKPIDSFFREVPIPKLGPKFTIPVQVLMFERSALHGRDSRIVIYTFHVNGQFAASRRDVQSVLSNPLDRYAYFSKLEVTFGTQEQVPPKDVAIEAGDRLLQAVVPVLLKEHWPDWEAVTKAAASRPAPADGAE